LNPLYSAAITFAVPLVAGAAVRRGLQAADMSADPLLTLSQYQKHLNNYIFAPISALLSLWALNLSQARLVALPALGLVYLVGGALVGALLARLMGMGARQRGVFLFAGLNGNQGMLGGLLCFLFFGETGYAIASFIRLFESPFYFLIGYPTISAIGSGKKITVAAGLKQIVTDAAIWLPILGTAVGMGLSLAGMQRPVWLGQVNSLLIPLTAANVAFAIGVTVRIGAVTENLKACGAMIAVKFAILPALIFLFGQLSGLSAAGDGLPFKVALLLSFMPVGVTVVMAATLFDLDEDLAMALWLATTVTLVPVLPLLKPLMT
jgi:predicted permease